MSPANANAARNGKIMNSTEIGKVSDGELNRQFSGLRKLLKVSKFSDKKRLELEVQLCYIQREMEIREKRKTAHEEYTRSRPRRYRPRSN